MPRATARIDIYGHSHCCVQHDTQAMSLMHASQLVTPAREGMSTESIRTLSFAPMRLMWAAVSVIRTCGTAMPVKSSSRSGFRFDAFSAIAW